MSKLRFNAIVTTSLLAVTSAGVVLAGGDHGHGRHGRGGGPLAAHLFERLDANKDGQMTRAEAQTAAESLFVRLDTNKDGAVTEAEGEAGAQAIAREEIDARFKTLDANADGRVTLEESKLPPGFFTKLDKNSDKALTRDELDMGGRFSRGRFAFKKADTNRDGKVTREEGTQAALARFDRADRNDDGVITREELESPRGKHGKGHRKHERPNGTQGTQG